MFDIDQYIKDGMHSIRGWCFPITAHAMHYLSSVQDIPGNVVEIGIFHGKSFMPLAGSLKSEETAIAIDVFEDQHLNIDNTGIGDSYILKRNLERFLPDANVLIIKADSTKLKSEDIPGPVRFISIDGGHSANTVYSDLKLADSILDKYFGIMFLDDIFNTHWLGVLSGYLYHSRDFEEAFVPIALFPNKLVLCRTLGARQYKELLLEYFKDNLSKPNVPFMEHFIDIYE